MDIALHYQKASVKLVNDMGCACYLGKQDTLAYYGFQKLGGLGRFDEVVLVGCQYLLEYNWISHEKSWFVPWTTIGHNATVALCPFLMRYSWLKVNPSMKISNFFFDPKAVATYWGLDYFTHVTD